MRSFRRLTLVTLVAVYVLILVGGIVRSTGSGMGCPDWPKCFGNWVPPTSIEQLPDNYKDIYANHRHKKNLKFARYLDIMGMDEAAAALLNDKSVLIESDFNPQKTLIEYINRLVGVSIGFLIIAVFVRSLKFWRAERRITIASFAALFLVVFTGWIGSFVVSTNLTAWVITVHMFLALAIVALLVYVLFESSYSDSAAQSAVTFWWLIACISVVLVQILLGTHVREAIDGIASFTPRVNWISETGIEFIKHRSFSWMVLILHIGLIVNLRKIKPLKTFPLVLIILILGTILSGAGMAYFAVPALLQPLHLLLATVTFGIQFWLLLRLRRREEPAFKLS